MLRGQSLQMNLPLGSPVESLLLPIGGFVQDTGGNWVFVVDSEGNYANRRDIRVGRRNNRYVEVIDGLQQGDIDQLRGHPVQVTVARNTHSPLRAPTRSHPKPDGASTPRWRGRA